MLPYAASLRCPSRDQCFDLVHRCPRLRHGGTTFGSSGMCSTDPEVLDIGGLLAIGTPSQRVGLGIRQGTIQTGLSPVAVINILAISVGLLSFSVWCHVPLLMSAGLSTAALPRLSSRVSS